MTASSLPAREYPRVVGCTIKMHSLGVRRLAIACGGETFLCPLLLFVSPVSMAS
jgi:hypothetical protein